MAKLKKPPPPDDLTMRLFDPGMSALHRAGLGGLACTLKAMERHYENGLLSNSKLPAPFVDGAPPWDIDDQQVTLKFGKPEHAGEYLNKLFQFAFQIKDGLIYLPGAYGAEPSSAVLADLQSGLTLTFLQHGKVRHLAKEPTTVCYDPEGDCVPGIIVRYRKCTGFKHQEGWVAFVDKLGRLVSNNLKVDGPISPGAVVRHVAFTGDTTAEDPAERMMPLYFALVGCLPLPVNRGVAALLVPEVGSLVDFAFDRPAMTPTAAYDCQIANAADAAFRAQIRARDNPVRSAAIASRAKGVISASVPGCYAMTFTPTAWASQQKSRVATIQIPLGDAKTLDRFERALSYLPPRVVIRTVKETSGRGKQKTVVERHESFRADSVVRPLIAQNLALGQPWYAEFTRFLTKIDPATDKPYRTQLRFERKGLHAMIADETMWDNAAEGTVVRAVHEALRCRYGQIADENKGNPVAMRNRFSGEYDRWRLGFAGAKTADQFRNALCDLFSRAGRNSVLQTSWQEILPMLRSQNWHHTRDLALLALCSYTGKGDAEVDLSNHAESGN